jgi:hypothetical protein
MVSCFGGLPVKGRPFRNYACATVGAQCLLEEEPKNIITAREIIFPMGIDMIAGPKVITAKFRFECNKTLRHMRL